MVSLSEEMILGVGEEDCAMDCLVVIRAEITRAWRKV